MNAIEQHILEKISHLEIAQQKRVLEFVEQIAIDGWRSQLHRTASDDSVPARTELCDSALDVFVFAGQSDLRFSGYRKHFRKYVRIVIVGEKFHSHQGETNKCSQVITTYNPVQTK